MHVNIYISSCTMIRWQISCKLETWLVGALIGQHVELEICLSALWLVNAITLLICLLFRRDLASAFRFRFWNRGLLSVSVLHQLCLCLREQTQKADTGSAFGVCILLGCVWSVFQLCCDLEEYYIVCFIIVNITNLAAWI